MTNATSDVLMFASTEGDTSKNVSAEGVTYTSWTSGGSWLRGKRTHTLPLVRTIAGAPVGEEDAD